MFKFARGMAALAACGMAALAALTAAKEPVTIRFTVWDGAESMKVLTELKEQFEKENPDIRIKLEQIDFAAYHQKMLIQYASKIAPDVAMMDPAHFQALAKRNALLPINDFLDKDPELKYDDYYKPLMEAHSSGGKLWVLPRDIAPMGLIYYNKELFDKAGIPYPDGSWTWDYEVRPELREKDFLWVMQQLTNNAKETKDKVWGYASGWPELSANSFSYSQGALWADDSENPTKVLANDPRRVKSYQLAGDIMNKHNWSPNSTQTTGVLMATTQQLFARQQIAMYQNGIWEVPNIRKVVVPGEEGFFEWDITMFPAYKDGSRGFPTGGSGYCIFETTEHPEEAWRVVRYFAGPPGMIAMAKAGIAQPGIKELALQPGLWVPGPDTPLEQRYPANRIVTHEAVDHVVFDPKSDLWPLVQQRIIAGLELIWNGQGTAEERLAVSQQRGQDRLDASLKQEELPDYDWRIGGAFAVLLVGILIGWVYWPERKRKLSSRQRKENLAAYAFLTPWLIGLAAFTLGPMVLSLLMSFADWDIIMPAKFRGFQNYVEAFTDDVTWKSLKATAIYTLFGVPLGLAGALGLALLLNMKVKGIALYRAVYYLPSLVSLVAASLIWRRIFNPEDGLLNQFIFVPGTWLGDATAAFVGNPGKPIDWLGTESTALGAIIIMSLWGVGGGMIILLAGLQGIPGHYYEAARLDGAGPWQRFKAVTFPLLTPALFFSLITGVIGSWQVFTQALVMTNGGPNDSTNFFMFWLYNNAFTYIRMGYASALAWILFFIIMIFTVIQLQANRFVYYEGGDR